uniref:Arrestin C-terminal-like domain-containing protein n=1 Tax=Mycena chlorophos TaxID=658473 RepID=A0ABQ0M3I6_MYCCL|nr:predicted protein [Mycena chlorophos]
MKNDLAIRLTEAAVFVQTNENNARRRTPQDSGCRPALLRGLLSLNLAKPTKITCIELELQAKATTSWPEGIGARRVDVQEDHKVFSESVVFFRAGAAPRRHASVGPGVHPWDDDSIPPTPDTSNSDLSFPRGRAARRVSVDSTYFHNNTGEEYDRRSAPPIPPYSPLPSPPPSSAASQSHFSLSQMTAEDPAHALEDFRNALRASLPMSRSHTGDRSPGPVRSSGSSFRDPDRSLSRRPSIDTLAEVEEDSREPPPSSPNRDARGRRARFSLTSVSNALKEAVRSGSRTQRSKECDEPTLRGRPREKTATNGTQGAGRSMERHNALSKLVGFKEDKDKDHEKSDGWKEFKKGTYTFPISFAIPPAAPPTMECPWGTVVWRLKAVVHRPGALTSRMTATREVIVVAAPMDDDTEETENIVVERHWEQQLQYLISVSGRSYPIGGTIPLSMTLMPLAKVKIHRLTVCLEEKVEYYSQLRRIVRSDPVVQIPLLSVKHPDKKGGPILPLNLDEPNVLETTPLLELMSPEDDLSVLASEWMGAGPWTFHRDLQIPPSCAALHFTNKNKQSSMVVTHLLKCIIRIERGDDAAIDSKTGKRKLFDIVVQTPVHILSCRCNPEWMALPQYSSSFDDPADAPASCPCQETRHGLLERMATHHSSDSGASAVVDMHGHGHVHGADSLLARNTLFERLVSGQESEAGEAPPAYVTL